MKISRIKFLLLFVATATVFIMVTTLLLGQPAETVAGNGLLGVLLSPFKMILMGPMLPFIHFLRQDPDTPPPFFLMGFAFYWSMLALLLYYVISKVKILYGSH